MRSIYRGLRRGAARLVGRRDGRREELSDTFAAALTGPRPAPGKEPGEWLGVEHEYRVLRGDTRVDFRTLIHSLSLGQAHLDPGDFNAYRLPSGESLTCDGAEAEIALPPIRCRPGYARRADAAAQAARARLRTRLHAGMDLEGYSTHLSVSVPNDLAEPAAKLYARTFAPALMLLMDAAHSPGLLIRPRPGRVELCGEFADSAVLRAAAAFAVGSVRACAAHVAEDHTTRGRSEDARIPSPLEARVASDVHRYGWYLDRTAFGEDLYRHGRNTRLRRTDGGTITAQRQLEAAWQAARNMLAGCGDGSDFAAADAMVSGARPLRIEANQAESSTPPGADQAKGEPEAGTLSLFGSLLKARHRPGFDLAPVFVTWHATVFLIVNPARTRFAFACLPREFGARFLIRVATGGFDSLICAYLGARPSGRRLCAGAQAAVPGLYDELGPRRSLLPVERPAAPFALSISSSRHQHGADPVAKF